MIAGFARLSFAYTCSENPKSQQDHSMSGSKQQLSKYVIMWGFRQNRYHKRVL